MTIEARPIVKNKYWIVENNGEKIGTIQAANDGVVLVQGNRRDKYPSIKILGTTHNIKFVKSKSTTKTNTPKVYDYPILGQAYNTVYDLKLRLPLYTKSQKSKSYYCAGYYLVNLSKEWILEFCPKKIILVRNEFLGPFVNKDTALAKLAEISMDK